jgi:hypothetical protein
MLYELENSYADLKDIPAPIDQEVVPNPDAQTHRETVEEK